MPTIAYDFSTASQAHALAQRLFAEPASTISSATGHPPTGIGDGGYIVFGGQWAEMRRSTTASQSPVECAAATTTGWKNPPHRYLGSVPRILPISRSSEMCHEEGGDDSLDWEYVAPSLQELPQKKIRLRLRKAEAGTSVR